MPDQPPSPTPLIPISSALSEASPDSLQELFSRDPEKYQSQDLSRIISAMREHRERLAVAAAAGKRVAQPKVAAPQLPTAPLDASDLGI